MSEHTAENDARVLVTVTFLADPGVTAEDAYDAAEAMVSAAPEKCAVLTFGGIETRVIPPGSTAAPTGDPT